jgi:hypothetical protein
VARGARLSLPPELPPKSLGTLNALSIKRHSLQSDLSAYCIDRYGSCHDLPRARDFLRSYACSFFDYLTKAYSDQISTWNWEAEIAEEAIENTLRCWANFGGAQPRAEQWIETLRAAIVQHVGHPLRGQTRTQLLAPSEYAKIGVDIEHASPLLAGIIAAHKSSKGKGISPTAAATQITKESRMGIEDRLKLLAEYKHATGNPSNKKIYSAHNSGIHKPEFYQWLDGRLPATSKTAKNFEAFLKSKRRPIPRKPTS